MEKKKITVVMVGDESNTDKRGVILATKREITLLRDVSGLPLSVLKENAPDVEGLEYGLATFVVNFGGGLFVEGYCPYYATEDSLDADKFYFGSLMLKNGLDDWYLAPWVNPTDNEYEMVTFERAADFDAAFVESLLKAMEDYRKSCAA